MAPLFNRHNAGLRENRELEAYNNSEALPTVEGAPDEGLRGSERLIDSIGGLKNRTIQGQVARAQMKLQKDHSLRGWAGLALANNREQFAQQVQLIGAKLDMNRFAREGMNQDRGYGLDLDKLDYQQRNDSADRMATSERAINANAYAEHGLDLRRQDMAADMAADATARQHALVLGAGDKYDPASVQQFMQTGQAGALKPIAKPVSGTGITPSKIPNYYEDLMNKRGYDTTDFYDGEKKPTPKRALLLQTMDVMRKQDPTLSDDALMEAAAGAAKVNLNKNWDQNQYQNILKLEKSGIPAQIALAAEMRAAMGI